jgi:flagellar hook-associated protein 2
MVTATTSTTSSITSLNGLGTGIDTTALINAIVAQDGTGVTRLKAQQTLNNSKVTTLATMKTELTGLVTSMATLQDRFNSPVVASTDSSNTYVSATAGPGSSGSYDVTVSTVATRGRLSAQLDSNGQPTNLSVANPSDSVGSPIYSGSTPTTFAVQGTDGKIYKITLDASSNTLNGLRDQINTVAGSSVTASVVNTGKGSNPYQLVVMAKNTGTGSTGGLVTIADITNMASDGTAGPVANNLGIAAGSSTDSLTKNLTGLSSATAGAVATDANFTVNGISLTRSSNLVKDVVDGMTFTLKQGGQAGVTTLTVGQDTAGATAAVQDFITKYNTLVKDYQTASTATKNADGSIAQAPLSNDTTTRTLMNNLRGMLAGASAGLPSTATFKSLASVGITNQPDGSLYFNTYAFQQAMNTDPASVQDLFSFSGSSTSPSVSVTGGGAQTATGTVGFTITRNAADGTLWGTLTPQNGVASDPIQVINGTLSGTGTLAGLSLSVSGTGTGTLTLSRGAGQAASDLLSSFTSTTGGMANLLKTINAQNANLVLQIAHGQSLLDQETANLKNKFAQMEATVGQMTVTSGSLFGASSSG